jgi:ankyrin repeat protein
VDAWRALSLLGRAHATDYADGDVKLLSACANNDAAPMLVRAALRGDVAVVRALLALGVDELSHNESLDELRCDDKRVTSADLVHCCRFSDESGTALHVAARRHRADVIDALLDDATRSARAVNCQCAALGKQTALHVAAAAGDVDCVTA